MEYPWYEEIQRTCKITQGDIIPDCPIPLPNEELFQAILENKEEIESKIDIKKADVIVLSQACDIENNKIDSIIVCPIWALKTLINSSGYYASSEGWESLRKGKEPAYHLLNSYTSDTFNCEFLVVDFHRIYSLPKNYLKSIAKNIEVRLRLLPPYREHLSQAFARYFMRVGLPMDIDKSSLKQYVKKSKHIT